MADACGQMKTIGQTLFLGASVVSININLGWGETSSSATVELVEDAQPFSCYVDGVSIDPFRSNVRNYPDNHYYTCMSDSECYIDEFGYPYDPNRLDAQGKANPPKEKNVPGKIYYVWTNNGVTSRYWYQEDPGFFGTGTRVNPDGTLSAKKTNIYNLINVPVCLKFDNLVYIGIIKSWETNFNNGTNYYKVEIESLSTLLRNSHIILDGYAGAVFSYAPGYDYGAPRNYTGDGLRSTGTIQSGNIHNVFNVYGFLESLGPYGFGGSNKNERGISYNKILKAIKVLTSSINIGDLYWKSKNMFSPFGRILGKTMMKINAAADATNSSLLEPYQLILPSFGNHAFGVIPPTLDAQGQSRVTFTLDLSELRVPPEDVRLDTSAKHMTIAEFIQKTVDINGQQSYWVSGQSVTQNGTPLNIIKVKAVDRTRYSRPYSILNTVKNLQNSGLSVSTSSSRQSKNEEAKVRTLFLGGQQQRLYQVKNYRLAFNQNNFIWDPVNNKFIDYRRFDKIRKDMAKVPFAISTRNPAINVSVIPGPYANILQSDQFISNIILQSIFTTPNNAWYERFLKSEDASCITIYRSKDFAVDKNTGLPSENTNIGGQSFASISIGGNYEVLFTNDSTIALKPIESLPKPSTSASTTVAPPPPSPTRTVSSTTANIVSQSQRFIPLYRDILSPFFGFKYERSFPLGTDSNIFRNIRPVWMDTWTGQICVTFDMAEAPPVACGPMISLYDSGLFNKTAASLGGSTGITTGTGISGGTSSAPPPPAASPGRNYSMYRGIGFTITETEMRAALVGRDSYREYCEAKMNATKPDLYLMLLNCWQGKGASTAALSSTAPGGSSTGITTGTAITGGAGSSPLSAAGSTGHPSKPTGAQATKLSNIDFSVSSHPGFIADLNIIVKFIADIAAKYYGKQYMVGLPFLTAYRDQQFIGSQIPGFGGGKIFVYSGSGKIMYSYDLTENAWEEPGNFIDEEIVVGGPFWKVLSNDKGLIPPILGFNISDKIDYVRKTWCALTALDKARKLSALRNEAIALAEAANKLTGFAVLFDATLPNQGNLLTWSIRYIIPVLPTAIPTSVSEPLRPQKGQLTGFEEDSYIQFKLNLPPQAFAIFKNLQRIKQAVSAVYASMPSALECSVEESIQENFVLDPSYPCVPPTEDQAFEASQRGFVYDLDTRHCEPNHDCVSYFDGLPRDRVTSPGCGHTEVNSITKVYTNNNAFLIPSINYSLLNPDGENYVIVTTSPYKDAFGSGLCGGAKKLYMKANLENNSKIAFENPSLMLGPRAIIGIGRHIELAQNSLVYTQEPNLFVMPNVAAEDVAFYRNAYSAGTKYAFFENGTKKVIGTGVELSTDEYKRLEYLESTFLTPLKAVIPELLLTPGSKINVSTTHRKIAPKAAQPFFAAIPLKSNRYTYGPWTNYPDLHKDKFYNYITDPTTVIENLIDNVELSYNADYVPWNYGGVSFLDRAVLYEIESKQNFQVVQEGGTVRMVGPPIFTVGGHFSELTINALQSPYTVVAERVPVYDYPEQVAATPSTYVYNILTLNDFDNSAFGGYPTVQSISISVGAEGVSTSYNLGTYNPKHGLYNKERIDEMKNLRSNILSLGERLTKTINKAQEDQRQLIYNLITDQERYGEIEDFSTNDSFFGTSPTEMLIGQARTFLPDPGSSSPPKYLENYNSSNIAERMMRAGYRHETWAGMFMASEVTTELLQDYSNKAAMSLDGFFSPISFYPTQYGSTYSLSNHFTTKFLISETGNQYYFTCPICKNARFIVSTYVNYSNAERAETPIKYPCPSCSKSRVSYIKGSGNPQDKMPRVIIDPKNKNAEINFYTLNPIVMSVGEFSNYNAVPSGIVSTKHSIRAVARGEYLPGQESKLDTSKNLTYNATIIDADYEEFDSNAASTLGGTTVIPLNQRFFGFRGPMMLHGWGYDTDGYPIPNEYDDPFQTDQFGRYLRFQLDINGFNDLKKPGLFDTNNPNILLGDIITKRYESRNGIWVRKSTPSKYFAENWASKPNTWPVGPIDLRWDHNRRVWVGGGAGCGEEKLPPYILTNSSDASTLKEYLDTKPKSSCPYKMVYITLEQDLTRPSNVYYYSNITRGYIDDLEYKSESLPAGYRRLVYLIDRSGYTAPAGARLYCKYNPDLGYYEPISKPTFITTGLIGNGNARIDLNYAKGRLSNFTPNTVVTFSNPLQFYTRIGARAIFSYIEGSWTLTAVN